jgi:ABC transporter substrate binding protein
MRLTALVAASSLAMAGCAASPPAPLPEQSAGSLTQKSLTPQGGWFYGHPAPAVSAAVALKDWQDCIRAAAARLDDRLSPVMDIALAIQPVCITKEDVMIEKTIPIVTVTGDAIATGLIDSLNRPGGNVVTGITFLSSELMAKRLELLKDAVPLIKIAGLLANAANPVTTAAIDMLQAITQSLNVRLHPVLVRAPAISTVLSPCSKKKASKESSYKMNQ